MCFFSKILWAQKVIIKHLEFGAWPEERKTELSFVY